MRGEFIAGAIGQGMNSFMDSYLQAQEIQSRKARSDEDAALRRRQQKLEEKAAGVKWDDTKQDYTDEPGFLSKADTKKMSGLLEAQKAAGENWYRNEYAPYRQALDTLLKQNYKIDAPTTPGSLQRQPEGISSPVPRSAGPGLIKRQPVTVAAPPSAPQPASPYAPLKQKVAGRHAPGINPSDWAPGYLPKAEREQQQKNQSDLLSIEMKEADRSLEGPKQNQAQAGSFASSAKKAEDKFSELEGGGFNRADAKYAAYTDVSKIPLVGGLLSTMTPANLAQQNAAERAFLNSVMRRDSGATIPPAEMAEGARLYFPRPGDDPKTLEFKKQNRIGRIAALEAEAGPDLMKKLGEQETSLQARMGGASKPSTPKGPAVGETQEGHVFLGGNPADPKSWRPVNAR